MELAFDETLAAAPTVSAAAVNTADPTDNTDYSGTYTVVTPATMKGDAADNTYETVVTPTGPPAGATFFDVPPLTITLTLTGADMATPANAFSETVTVQLAAQPYDDKMAPEVEVIPSPTPQSKPFGISFTATDNYSEGADLTIEVAIIPATAVTDATPMAEMQGDGSYMVMVTPVAATEATTIDPVTIKVTVTATDEASNVGSGSEFFFLAEREYEDETPPVLLTSTVGTPDDTTGAVTVELTFDEMFTTAPKVMGSTAPGSAIAGRYMVSEVTGSDKSFMVTVAPNPLAVGDADFPGGTVMLTVTGTDVDGNALAAGTTVNVTLPVLPAPTAPTDNAPMFADGKRDWTAVVGTMVNIKLPAATDAEDDAAGVALTYSVDTLPTGLTFNDDASGQRVTGEPTAPGVVTVTYTVMDSAGQKVSIDITLTVSSPTTPIVIIPDTPDPSTPEAPDFGTATVSVPPLTVGTAMTPVSLPEATGGTGTISYSLWVGLKDITTSGYNGLSLDAANITLVSGTTGPLAADATGTLFTWRATDANNLSDDLDFTVVVNPGTTETPDTRAIGTLSTPTGMASLKEAFQVTIMFDKAAPLAEGDIMITPAGAGYVDSNSLHPATGSATEFTVTIRPTAGAKMITVTLAANDSIKPSATAGSLMASAPIGMVKSITGPAEFDGTDPFVVELEFAAALPALEALVAADLKVDGGSATDVGSKLGSDTIYEIEITPTDTADVVVGLSTAGMVRFDYGTGVTALTIPQKADAPTPGVVITVTEWNEETGIAKLSGLMPANPFASISRLNAKGEPNFPDLQAFFEIGGTIDLMDDDPGDGDDDNSREVVISEILWGLDESAPTINEETKWQFIELYNTTGTVQDITGWTLVFTEGRPSDAKIDVDQVSNEPRFAVGFDFTAGKSGRVTRTKAEDPDNTLFPESIVSMYRNINYDKVEKVKADGTPDPDRAEQLKGIPAGDNNGSWVSSKRRDPKTVDLDGNVDLIAARWVYATRNQRHHTTTPPLTKTEVSSKPFRINEFGNDTGSENDWVELHNTSDAAVSLKNYQLTAVTAPGTDTELFDFIGDEWDNRKVPAGDFVVISTRHPQYTDLATGKDISIAADLQAAKGLQHLYLVKPNWNLPDDGKFTLILRGGHGDAHKSEKSAKYIIDVAASPDGGFEDVSIASKLWPLVGSGAPGVIKGDIKNFIAPKVYQRDGGDGRAKENFSVAGYTGIGYDIKAEVTGTNHGTPGYANDANRNTILAPEDGVVKITEIMVDVGDSERHNLPQWIELHNSSDTLGVNLNGWKVNIENAALAGVDPETNTFYATITLGAFTILPNQTVLIASRSGEVRRQEHFPDTRVINLWTTKAHKEALEMTRSTDQVLSSRGFSIELVDKDGAPVDRVGNLDGVRHTRDEPAWAIPMHESDERDRSRSSMIRVHEDKVALTGTMEEAWVLASDTILAFERTQAYYGDGDDISSPGYRFGGPLPVSLSKFRPERLDDGTIVVRWITESELNNAGFNILRSETRDGQFTQMNTSLIKGQGTTSERTTYSFPDTSAKPNVVYYYQIQDVSLDGNVTTLRQSRLKGHISAAGKLTTTWGELKALQ